MLAPPFPTLLSFLTWFGHDFPAGQFVSVRASDKRVRIFSRASKLANSSQNVRHSARGQNIQIGTFDVIRVCKTFESS